MSEKKAMKYDFRSVAKQKAELTDEQVDEMLSRCTESTAKKNEIVFWGDRPFLKLWFLKSGIMRMYRVIDGKDVTFFFFFRGEFAVDYESFLTEHESPLFFEALTDCEYLILPKRSLLELYNKEACYERIGRVMAEEAYISATNRLKQYQADPLIVRYQKLLEKDPVLFQQVPQYHIASYLGVKPQSLSRVKTQLLNKE